MTEMNEAKLLGLDEQVNIPELRTAVGQFRLVTREKWQYVLRLKKVCEKFGDLKVSDTKSFENSLANALAQARRRKPGSTETEALSN